MPNSTSATALPRFDAQHPGLEDRRRVLGQPRQSPAAGRSPAATTTGLPVSRTRRASASWLAGSSMFERLRASPREVEMLADHEHDRRPPTSPPHRGRDAGAIVGCAARRRPRTRSSASRGARGLDACSIVTTSSALPCARHEPSNDMPSLASAPTHGDAAQLRRDRAAAACRRSSAARSTAARCRARLRGDRRDSSSRASRFGIVVLHRPVEQARAVP